MDQVFSFFFHWKLSPTWGFKLLFLFSSRLPSFGSRIPIILSKPNHSWKKIKYEKSRIKSILGPNFSLFKNKIHSNFTFQSSKFGKSVFIEIFFIILMKMTRLTRENDLCFPLFFKSHGFHSNYLVIMKFLGVFFSGFKGVPLWKKSTFSHNLNKNVSLYSRKRFLKKLKTNSSFPNKTGFPLWTLSNHFEKENGSFHL